MFICTLIPEFSFWKDQREALEIACCVLSKIFGFGSLDSEALAELGVQQSCGMNKNSGQRKHKPSPTSEWTMTRG